MASDSKKKIKKGSDRGSNMSDDKTDTLITVVEGKRGLWDHGHVDFKKPKSKKDVWWDDVGKIVKCSGPTCYNKWKNLLRDFRQELKKQPPARSGDATSDYKPGFKWFDRMRFVNDNVTPRKSSGNFEKLVRKSKKPRGNESSDEDSFDDDAEYEENLEDYAALLLTPKQKKKHTNTQPPPLAEREENAGTKTVAQLEEHEHYMRSVVPRIRHLTDVQNILFRGKLSELVIKFAYQEIGLYAKKM